MVVLAQNDEVDVASRSGSIPRVLLVETVQVVSVTRVGVLGIHEVKVGAWFDAGPRNVPECLPHRQGRAAVTFVVQLIPALSPPEVKILSMADFAEIPMVVSVDARPPSLFGRINGARWGKLDRQGRLGVINEVGYIIAKADYNGAKFRDENGVLVGEWIRGVGTYEFPAQ